MKDDIKDYISYITLEKKLSKNTIYNYKIDLEKFYLYFLDKGFKEIKKITLSDLNIYFNSLKKNGLDARSIARHTTSIKELYKYLIKSGRVKEDITLNLENIKQSKKLPNVLGVDDVMNILDIESNDAFQYRNKVMLELIYGSGLRVSELVNLTVYSIDLEQDTILIEGKGHKQRIVPINAFAKTALVDYLDVRPLLIKSKNGYTDKLFLNNHGKGITRQGFNLILRKILNEKDLDAYVTPHTLRHSFATHMLNNGADLRSIQELLGHSDIVTTRIYTHVANNKIKDDYIKYSTRKEE